MRSPRLEDSRRKIQSDNNCAYFYGRQLGKVIRLQAPGYLFFISITQRGFDMENLPIPDSLKWRLSKNFRKRLSHNPKFRFSHNEKIVNQVCYLLRETIEADINGTLITHKEGGKDSQ